MRYFNIFTKGIKRLFFVLEAFATVLIGALAMLLWCSALWMFHTWPNLNMDELMYQLNAPMEGTNLSMVMEYINYCVPAVVIAMMLIILVLLSARKKEGYHKLVVGLVILSVCGIAGVVYYTGQRLDIKNYTVNQGTYSTFIDDNYVNPENTEISFPEQKRNLIYIYLESMEITYADKENGGGYEENYIPELTGLAQENEDFSGDSLKLNGGYTMPSTTWTVAGMFAHSSGLPLSIPVGDNSMNQQETFLPKVVALGDILEEAGYNQMLLIGSDATFGGRRQLYTDHGGFQIRDYNYAVENGWIPPDYRVWWGYEDQKLFEFAKTELLDLAAQNEPFNFTMLTVDSHFEDGYYCEICEDIHDGNAYGNVLSCSSKQITDFVRWVQQQEFYENTTIVITGDHLTMDSDFCEEVDKNPNYDRKVYTNYINSAVETEKPELRREFTTFDDFPTTLASMGVHIEGNRLGLGTNLFSDEYTLSELYGRDRVESELRKKSKLMEEFTSDIVVEEPEEAKIVEDAPSAVLTLQEYDYTDGYMPLYISEIDDKGKGISAVNVAVWVEDDQSDIQWMQAESQANGDYVMNINIPDFDFKTGDYKITVYLVDNQGTQHMLGNTIGHVE